jgi:hypothetical protein
MRIKRKWCRGCKTKRAHSLELYVNLVDTCPLWNGLCGCALFDGSEEEAQKDEPCHGGYTRQWTCGRCNKQHHRSAVEPHKWTVVKE